MQRRSAIGRLAATLTGLSLEEVSVAAAGPPSGGPFSVSRSNLAESSGVVTCPVCQEMGDSLELTPAGPCLRCADTSPELRAEPHSDRFWILSPQEVRRLEPEIERIAAALRRMNQQLLELGGRQIAEGGEAYDRAVESRRQEWHALQRELHLLHLLRAASRQYAR
ncbi:MAG TPA: hypothetical protein VFZ87_02055 [Gemmatimonadales bacterium]